MTEFVSRTKTRIHQPPPPTTMSFKYLAFLALTVSTVHGASRVPRGFKKLQDSRRVLKGMGSSDESSEEETGCQEILVRVEGNEILSEQYSWSRGSGNILEPMPQDEYGYNLNLYSVDGTEKVGVVAENLFYLPPGDTGFNCLGREIWTFFDFETEEQFGTITDQVRGSEAYH